MLSKEIKFCGMCGEEDIIEMDKIHCDDCLNKIKEKNQKNLTL